MLDSIHMVTGPEPKTTNRPEVYLFTTIMQSLHAQELITYSIIYDLMFYLVDYETRDHNSAVEPATIRFPLKFIPKFTNLPPECRVYIYCIGLG